MCFYLFNFFIWWYQPIKYRTGDKKLSVELYDKNPIYANYAIYAQKVNNKNNRAASEVILLSILLTLDINHAIL